MHYEFTGFNIESDGISFCEGIGDYGALISIPFAEDTPKRIKDKLNEMIDRNMNQWSRNCLGDILKPEKLLLSARLQIGYYGQGGLSPCYSISMLISDFCIEAENTQAVWIDDTYDIQTETPDFRREFKTYCKDRLNRVLFPVG